MRFIYQNSTIRYTYTQPQISQMMNYFFSKYSNSNNQSTSSGKTTQATDESKLDTIDSGGGGGTPSSTHSPNRQSLNLALNSNSNSHSQSTTPISFTNSNSNAVSKPKLTLDFKKKKTTTEILHLQTNSSTSSQSSFTPNVNSTNTNGSNQVVLPALNRNNAQTQNIFIGNNSGSHGQSSGSSCLADDMISLRINPGGISNKPSSLSLMNQNGSNLRSRLSDYGDVLDKLKNGDNSNSGRPQVLTPLTIPSRKPELKQFDFRTGTEKEKRPSFGNFKQQLNHESKIQRENDINTTGSSLPTRTSPCSSIQPRLEQVNADKYREILKNAGYLLINGQRIKTSMDDLSSISELGSGTCGQVYKMVHNPTGYVMAVKQMGITGVAEENKRIIMDLDVVLKSHDCADIVKCLGYFISESDVWICMELMSMCFDKLLKQINKPIPEEVLGKMSVSTINALNYLKQTHNVIHRDIKPSNILINEQGQMKLCDFGISGNLINSNAKSRNNAGCAGYMAPERIDPPDQANPVYDIRADVWSLGLTLVELATGEYPYKKCKNEFEVMSTILFQEAPTAKLESENFSSNFKSFVNKCLVKDVNKRPKYNILLQHPFILQYKDPELEVDVESWFKKAIQDQAGSPTGHLTPVSCSSNLTIENESESTSTTPTATSNSITSI